MTIRPGEDHVEGSKGWWAAKFRKAELRMRREIGRIDHKRRAELLCKEYGEPGLTEAEAEELAGLQAACDAALAPMDELRLAFSRSLWDPEAVRRRLEDRDHAEEADQGVSVGAPPAVGAGVEIFRSVGGSVLVGGSGTDGRLGLPVALPADPHLDRGAVMTMKKTHFRTVLLAFYRHLLDDGKSPAQAVEAIQEILDRPPQAPTQREAVWLQALVSSIRLGSGGQDQGDEEEDEDMPLLPGRDRQDVEMATGSTGESGLSAAPAADRRQAKSGRGVAT